MGLMCELSLRIERCPDAGRETRWTAVTHALGGLFCAGLGPSEEESIKTFGHIYPPQAHHSESEQR